MLLAKRSATMEKPLPGGKGSEKMIVFSLPFWTLLSHQPNSTPSHSHLVQVSTTTEAPSELKGLLGAMKSFPGPDQYALDQLPQNFAAYTMDIASSNPMLTWMRGLNAFGGDGPLGKLSPYLVCVWSQGEELSYGGQTYLAVYSVINSLSQNSAAMETQNGWSNNAGGLAAGLKWSRIFVNERNISDVSAEPDLTVAKFDSELKQQAANPRGKALDQMKQLMLSVIMYSDDDNDRLPAGNSSEQVFMKLRPYVAKNTTFSSLNPNGGKIF